MINQEEQTNIGKVTSTYSTPVVSSFSTRSPRFDWRAALNRECPSLLPITPFSSPAFLIFIFHLPCSTYLHYRSCLHCRLPSRIVLLKLIISFSTRIVHQSTINSYRNRTNLFSPEHPLHYVLGHCVVLVPFTRLIMTIQIIQIKDQKDD